jgi:Ca-activated chloride channel family protein
LCLPLLLLALPQPSYAFGLGDLWLRPDQQAQRLLEAQRPREAAERFEDPQWQGLALYQAGDYAGAAERFASDDSAAAHYNRGNALALSNELEAAVEAYSQALERQADLAQAQNNMALVEALLRQRQEQQEQEQQEQQASTENPSSDEQAMPEPPQPGQPSQDADKQPSSQPTPGASEEPADQPAPGDDKRAPTPSEPDSEPNGEERIASAEEALGDERRQALEQWLRQIPDDPGELLRRKFWYEQQQRQEQTR